MRIAVVTGSSGGHIFPAISFIGALKKQCPDAQIILVLPQKAAGFKIAAAGFEIRYIWGHASTCPQKTGTRTCVSPSIVRYACTLINFFESVGILIRFRPNIVVGFGSLSSLPMILCAWACRIKTLIHEQNVVPGKANKLLAKFVNRVAISFDKTREYLKVNPRKIILTGNPLRQELRVVNKEEALEFFGLLQGRFTLLVSGGSQGSHRINECFFEAISGIKNKQNLQVIHITGNTDFAEFQEKYKNLDIKAKIFAFCDRMEAAYSAADLIVSRSGALTITELINFQKPAILIPYPFAAAHQLANAKVLSDSEAALLIKEEDLSAEFLKKNIENLLNLDTLNLMRQAFNAFTVNRADDLLVQAALTL